MLDEERKSGQSGGVVDVYKDEGGMGRVSEQIMLMSRQAQVGAQRTRKDRSALSLCRKARSSHQLMFRACPPSLTTL